MDFFPMALEIHFFLFNGSLLSVKLISVRESGGITIEFPIIIGLHQG